MSDLATILCVDDEETGLYFRKLILEGNGYRVLTATNQHDAMKLFVEEDLDLVVTDHLLGRSTGTKMAAEMKRQRPDLPIIVLSGTTDLPQDVNRVADAFISKTDGPERLVEVVNELLGKRGPAPRDQNSPEHQIFGTESAVQPLLAAIVESSDDAIFSKTLDGIITSWNRAATRIYGYTPEEIIGRSVKVLLPPDRPHEADNILERLRRGEKLDHFETTRMARDGRALAVSLTISPIRDRDGNVVGASTIARDITREKMAEQAVRNSEKLAVAGRMAATVAHEINNPLEAVTNILYLVSKSKDLSEHDRSFVLTAQEELKRIRHITRLTLGFHRDDETRKEPVNLAELIDNILGLYGRKIQSFGIHVERNFRDVLPVHANRGELRQVFSNLLLNAVDALADKGDRLRIHIHPSCSLNGPHVPGVRVTIYDNGTGIRREARRRLFEAFFTTKGEKGTGIGLWVSRSIVAKHGGAIRVRSSVVPGRSGTMFSVFLPFNFEQPKPKAA